ncbi:hypothetical protein BKA61DRAFT_665800 [Leptodontidium sp. MPI-SDFR-AT-0119]|nr:hypothetical protein BKA61DRAFT_665800 [Leptodontidium sp. MPI-SDFR-AT-0119]
MDLSKDSQKPQTKPISNPIAITSTDPSPDSQKPLTTNDKSDPPSPWNPLPYIKQALRLLGRTLDSLMTLLCFALYYTVFCGLLALVALFLTGLLLTVANSIACRPPIPSRVLPFCDVPISTTSHFELESLDKLQQRLGEIQEASAEGVTLPVLMKSGQSAIRELAINVELSDLPFKEKIGDTLREFHMRAHTAGDNLRTLNSYLDRTMDSIVITNMCTARALGNIVQQQEIDSNSGAITLLLNKGMTIFDSPKLSTEEEVKFQYFEHLSRVTEDINLLIKKAEISVADFEGLEKLLWSVTSLGKEEVIGIKQSKARASKKISAIFGFNWEQMEGLEEQSKVVLELLEQRDVAFATTLRVLEHLRDIKAGLEELRDRVTMPGRPQAQRVPLSVQIDTIHRGIERLERVRERTLEKKDRYWQQIRDQLR